MALLERAPSVPTRPDCWQRRGVDGVTVQEIVTAAGQRNNAALHYHFGSKEELIRQMVVDGAAVLDQRRREMLDEIEARDGPKSIREVMLVLMMPVIELGDDERWRGYIRFTSNLQASDPKTLRAALNNRWNSGYVAFNRCAGTGTATSKAIIGSEISASALRAWRSRPDSSAPV